MPACNSDFFGTASAVRSPLVCWVVACGAFALYIATLAPSYLWSDSAKLAIHVHQKEFAGTSFGHHPLHAIAGYVFSLLPLPFAYTQNLMSAFFAALTIFFVCRIVLLETGNPLAALLSGIALGISHLFWMYAVINETYSLLAFFFAVILYAAALWKKYPQSFQLWLIAFLLGAGFSNHGMTLLLIPGLVVFFWGPEFRVFLSSYRFSVAVLAFIAGGSPVFLLPLFQGASLSDLFAGLSQTTEEHVTLFHTGGSKTLAQMLRYPLYLVYQFPSPVLIAGFLAFKHRSRFLLCLFLVWLAVVLFACQYFLQRQFPMLIPSFVIFAVWIGLGLRKIKNPLLILPVLLLPPLVYFSVYRFFPPDLSFIRKLPYRNTARYYLFPPKYFETGAERYVEDALRQAEPNSVILADFNPGMALQYGRIVLGKRPDVQVEILIDAWIHATPDPGQEILRYLRKHAGKRTVYLADNYEPYYFTSLVRKEFELQQTGGPLWKVVPLYQTRPSGQPKVDRLEPQNIEQSLSEPQK